MGPKVKQTNKQTNEKTQQNTKSVRMEGSIQKRNRNLKQRPEAEIAEGIAL